MFGKYLKNCFSSCSFLISYLAPFFLSQFFVRTKSATIHSVSLSFHSVSKFVSSIYLLLNAYASQKEKSVFKLEYILWYFTIIPSGVQAAGMPFTCASQGFISEKKNAFDFQKGKLKRFILIVRIRDNFWINLQRRS